MNFRNLINGALWGCLGIYTNMTLDLNVSDPELWGLLIAVMAIYMNGLLTD